MGKSIKDMDGGREVRVERKGASLFLWGRGFSYEFDAALFRHALLPMLADLADVRPTR